jgi:hypothetical protein
LKYLGGCFVDFQQNDTNRRERKTRLSGEEETLLELSGKSWNFFYESL